MEFINRIIHALTQVHPLHPMLVHFPIALTGAGALFILLAVWKRNAALEKAAFFNLTLAALGTFAAGLAGLYDNIIHYAGKAPNAPVKIFLATTLLLITALTSYFRWRNPNLFSSRVRSLYVSAYLASFALAIVLAFLGAIILYGF
jgi:uncharacterized membrane protein